MAHDLLLCSLVPRPTYSITVQFPSSDGRGRGSLGMRLITKCTHNELVSCEVQHSLVKALPLYYGKHGQTAQQEQRCTSYLHHFRVLSTEYHQGIHWTSRNPTNPVPSSLPENWYSRSQTRGVGVATFQRFSERQKCLLCSKLGRGGSERGGGGGGVLHGTAGTVMHGPSHCRDPGATRHLE